jgi:hypothetical protein
MDKPTTTTMLKAHLQPELILGAGPARLYKCSHIGRKRAVRSAPAKSLGPRACGGRKLARHQGMEKMLDEFDDDSGALAPKTKGRLSSGAERTEELARLSDEADAHEMMSRVRRP